MTRKPAAAVLVWATFVGVSAAQQNLPEILANDNLTSAGRVRDGVLAIRLEAREGKWYPEAQGGPSLLVQAFAEEGRAPQIPGPMIRVPAGAIIQVSIRNTIPGVTLVVHGLHTRPGNDQPLEAPPGETRQARFPAGEPGTYYYWATTTGATLDSRFHVDSQLSGALIVDPPGARRPPDRVFLIGEWFELVDNGQAQPGFGRFAPVINGKLWPHTERLTYKVGEEIRWRWINASLGVHPMHLHGSHYRVDSKGDNERDTLYSPQQRRTVVTEQMASGSTMALTWTPNRDGNWLFHCHILAHISPEARLTPPASDPHAHHGEDHARNGMGGLVLGIHVRPRGSGRAPAPPQPRRLTLVMHQVAERYGKEPAYAFALQQGAQEPPPSSVTIPGPPLVLYRGERTSVKVVNRLTEPTSIHWHGMELESYYDGVAGWSGALRRLAPLVPPGGSFEAVFTPPRAGTFIYHTHSHDNRQLASGLYGPMIVLEPGARFDPETDRILLLSVGGPAEGAPILLNGSQTPAPIELRAGIKYRLRFINITPNNSRLTVSLLQDGSPANWRAVAKDGADLAPTQATARPARQQIGVGETYDFEFHPAAPGTYQLEVLLPALRETLRQGKLHLSLDAPERRTQAEVRVSAP